MVVTGVKRTCGAVRVHEAAASMARAVELGYRVERAGLAARFQTVWLRLPQTANSQTSWHQPVSCLLFELCGASTQVRHAGLSCRQHGPISG